MHFHYVVNEVYKIIVMTLPFLYCPFTKRKKKTGLLYCPLKKENT